MTDIKFPLSSFPGEHPSESSGRLINVFSQALGPGNPSSVVHYRSPGIETVHTSSEVGFRGITEIDATLFVAFNDKLLKGTIAAAPLAPVGSGSCPGTTPVFFSRNNKSPPDRVIVTEFGAFTFTPTTAPIAYPDSDLPQPLDVTFGYGFFFFGIGNNQVFASDPNSTAVNPLNFITAEGKPDSLLRVVFFGDRLYVLSDGSIEVWGVPINDAGFPLNRLMVIPRGIAGKLCVTGYENGFDLGIFFVGIDNKVSVLEGYAPVPISNSDVERDIAALVDKSVIEMSSYLVGGRPCIRVRCPQWTWVYDVQAKQWHERKSYLSETSRSMRTCFAYGRMWICGDTNSGNLGRIVENVYTEFGNPFVYHAESVPSPNYPRPIVIRTVRFKFATGVGSASGADPIETNPQVAISWTDDGGLHWSYPVMRSLGRQALFTDVVVNRTGVTGSHGRRWRVVVADPVHAGLMGGDMDMFPRDPAPRTSV